MSDGSLQKDEAAAAADVDAKVETLLGLFRGLAHESAGDAAQVMAALESKALPKADSAAQTSVPFDKLNAAVRDNVYDPATRSYYMPKNECYYFCDSGLYYFEHTGSYYSYDEELKTFRFYSPAEGSAAAEAPRTTEASATAEASATMDTSINTEASTTMETSATVEASTSTEASTTMETTATVEASGSPEASTTMETSTTKESTSEAKGPLQGQVGPGLTPEETQRNEHPQLNQQEPANDEEAVNLAGYVYDKRNGSYYNPGSNCYYFPHCQLYYYPSTNAYYSYNHEKNSMEFHSYAVNSTTDVEHQSTISSAS